MVLIFQIVLSLRMKQHVLKISQSMSVAGLVQLVQVFKTNYPNFVSNSNLLMKQHDPKWSQVNPASWIVQIVQIFNTRIPRCCRKFKFTSVEVSKAVRTQLHHSMVHNLALNVRQFPYRWHLSLDLHIIICGRSRGKGGGCPHPTPTHPFSLLFTSTF